MTAQQQKRKKWTEEEERSLMDKYAEMQSDGSLRRLRTREKRFRPIAAHVTAAHHGRDPLAYPFSWTWKDASTKVQNMRHQFLLVKQKLLLSSQASQQDLNWADGLSLWPNFLRYKHVFGDAPLPPKPSTTDLPPPLAAADDDDLGLGLGFDCCPAAEDGDEEGFDYDDVGPPPAPLPPLPLLPLPPPSPPPPPPPPCSAALVPRRKKKKKLDRKGWTLLADELARLRQREERMEEREAEREAARRRRDHAVAEAEAAAEREVEERERRRREEEREWEERMEQRRAEWRKRAEEMLVRHRAEMEQIHTRLLHEQQGVIGQLFGLLSQWTGPGMGTGLPDGAGMAGHGQAAYLSQMMQGLHHVNGMVPGEHRVGGDSQEDQFIVDD